MSAKTRTNIAGAPLLGALRPPAIASLAGGSELRSLAAGNPVIRPRSRGCFEVFFTFETRPRREAQKACPRAIARETGLSLKYIFGAYPASPRL
jgi:hypothetical protein